MRKLEGTRAQELRRRAEQLSDKRTAAQVELEAATAARQANLLAGDLDDDKVATTLQLRVDTAQSALSGFDDAIKALAVQLADAERELTDEHQRAARLAASKALELDVDVIETKLAPWIDATRELAALLDKHAVFRFETGAIGRFLINAASEVETAMAVTVADLRHAVTAIADGREAIPQQPRSEPATVARPIPPPETINVFVRNNIEFTDGVTKKLRRIDQLTANVDLPVPIAQRGLASGDVMLMTDERVKKLSGAMRPYRIGPVRWKNLDGSSGIYSSALDRPDDKLSFSPPVDRGTLLPSGPFVSHPAYADAEMHTGKFDVQPLTGDDNTIK